METIPPVEIGLLVRHAKLPTRDAILGLFADHYRASVARATAAAEAAAVADELGSEVLDLGEPLADLAELAAVEIEVAPEGDRGASDEGAPLGTFDLEGTSFDLGDDPFAALDGGSDDSGYGGDDVFALADEPAAETVSDLLDDEAALTEAIGDAADASAAEAELSEAEELGAELLVDEALLDDDLLADLDDVDADALIDEAEAYEMGLAPASDAPSVVVDEDAVFVAEDDAFPEAEEAPAAVEVAADEAEPDDATTMVQAMPDDEAEPEDATTMIQAMPDDDGAAPDDATTMVQAMPDDDAVDGPAAEDEGEDGQGTDRPTRRSRRASRKSKKK